MHARRTILFDNNNTPWVKKETKREFDVSMGAFDGAEVCELVELYALEQLQSKLNTHIIGLYRDDGLGALRRASGSRADRTRKELIRVFKDLGLQITVQTNLKSVDYLDVTLDLETETHQPYRKPNDTLVYIHTHSNHAPTPYYQTYPDRRRKAHIIIIIQRGDFQQSRTPIQRGTEK